MKKLVGSFNNDKYILVGKHQSEQLTMKHFQFYSDLLKTEIENKNISEDNRDLLKMDFPLECYFDIYKNGEKQNSSGWYTIRVTADNIIVRSHNGITFPLYFIDTKFRILINSSVVTVFDGEEMHNLTEDFLQEINFEERFYTFCKRVSAERGKALDVQHVELLDASFVDE